ncbi:restriction endonuclease subunit S [Roseateles sp. GG27B]
MATIHDLVQFNPKSEASDNAICGFVPMAGLGTKYGAQLKVHEERPWSEVKMAYTHFKNGDVLIAKVTPCFENGKAGIANDLPSGLGAGSSEFCVFRPSSGLDGRYLLGWFSSEDFRRRATLAMTGSVGLKRVPKDVFLGEQVPLAPAGEQQRIADKLDSLLARVDDVSARLARVAPLLKRFRQSVLAAATSGRLTEDWRNKFPGGDAARELAAANEVRARTERKPLAEPDLAHWKGEAPDGWVVASVHQFAECLDRIRVPIKRADRKSTLGLYPYFGANGEVGRIDEFIFDDELVLVTEDETFYGREKPIAYRSSGKCWVNNHAHVYRAHSREASDYLCFALMYYDVIPWLSGTTGRAKLTQQALNSLPIFAPPRAEMVEIVRRVELLFSFADSLETRLSAAHTATQRLTPALLAKAFRGELVPQDPNDEPASELLARIGLAKTAASKLGKKLPIGSKQAARKTVIA